MRCQRALTAVYLRQLMTGRSRSNMFVQDEVLGTAPKSGGGKPAILVIEQNHRASCLELSCY